MTIYYKFIKDASEFIHCFGFLRHLTYRGQYLEVDAYADMYGIRVHNIQQLFDFLENEVIVCSLQVEEECIRHINGELWTQYAYVQSVARVELESIKYLIEEGADIMANDCSIIVWACRQRDFELIQYLLHSEKRGAIIHWHGSIILMTAARHGQISIIETLINYGYYIRPYTLEMIHQAIIGKQMDTFMYLCENNSHVLSLTSACLAAFRGNINMLEYILNVKPFRGAEAYSIFKSTMYSPRTDNRVKILEKLLINYKGMDLRYLPRDECIDYRIMDMIDTYVQLSTNTSQQSKKHISFLEGI